MAIRVNQNLFSLLVGQKLNRVSDQLETVFQRLSSGERINKAGDDPSGLAVSHSLRHEIRGIHQNIRNVGDALSVTSITDAALGETTSLLQRMRELTLQAATETSSVEARKSIQAEIAELTQEIDRLATSTEFNGRYLLNGSSDTARIQVGTEGSQYITVTMRDSRTTILGRQAHVTGTNPASAAAIVGGGDLTINGTIIGASSGDGVSSVAPTASAIAKANAINQSTVFTGVRAEAEPAVYRAAGATISAVVLDGSAASLTINGINIGAVTVSAGDTTGTLVQAINARQSLTGVEASIGAGGELVLTAADGRNIAVTTTGGVADELGLSAVPGDLTNYLQGGQVTLWGSDTITVGGTLALIGLTLAQASTATDPNTALVFASVTTTDRAQQTLQSIDEALRLVLSWRAGIGAVQNRLESALEHLNQQFEELSASDARIRDADFAQESARLAQLQILQDTGAAILAQANMLPKNALSLLQQR